MKKNLGNSAEHYSAMLMAAPAVTGLLIFVALPFAAAVVLAFTNLRLGSPLAPEFVGLEQFRRIFLDASFRQALVNNTLFGMIVVPVQTGLALGLALLLNQRLHGMALFKTLFFMPTVFPMSLVAVVWILILIPSPAGMMNAALTFLTLGAWQTRDFLHDPLMALPAIMLLSIWQGCGFQMVIVLAGLQAIPEELYEAAAIDGANSWQQFLHITVPQLRNTLIFIALVTTILAFRLFDQVQIMTRGGPNNATTTVMYELVQTAFSRLQIGRAAAMTVVFFLVVLIVTRLQRMLAKQERELI
jgi:multiple sugar transport system permease protein